MCRDVSAHTVHLHIHVYGHTGTHVSIWVSSLLICTPPPTTHTHCAHMSTDTDILMNVLMLSDTCALHICRHTSTRITDHRHSFYLHTAKGRLINTHVIWFTLKIPIFNIYMFTVTQHSLYMCRNTDAYIT